MLAILCGAGGQPDRLMRCTECGREYMASELAALRTGHHHKQPQAANRPPGVSKRRPAHEGAGPEPEGGNMSAPITQTGNPEARQQSSSSERPPESLGDGHIMGNLTDDPELRFTTMGRAVARLRVAYTPRIKAETGDKWVNGPPEFYNLDVWGRQGERCAEHLRRGDRIVAAGSWTKRFWTDREGAERESVELTVRDIGPSLLFRDARLVRDIEHEGGADGE